jgi:hypothetical protein
VKLDTVGGGVRRGVGWVLKASAAVLTFFVVFRVTRTIDRSIPSIPRTEASAILPLAMIVWWVKIRLPFYGAQRRIALLEHFERLSVDSPEFTAAALRHFRMRSRVLGVAAVFTFLLACYGLISTFADAKFPDIFSVLALLFILLDGVLSLRAHAGRLSWLADAASGDELARLKAVRSLAFDAGASADKVSRAIWNRIIEPQKPALFPASFQEASTSAAT